MSKLKLQATDGNGGTVSLKGPASTTGNAEFELTLPGSAGSNGQLLSTNGSGVLTWTDDANAPEGTVVKSTGVTGTTKYLRADGDNTCSWQTVTSVGGATGVDFNDSVKARWGTGNELEIYHDGTNSLIENGTGNILIRGKTGENSIAALPDGAVKLFYDDSQKLATTSGGVELSGNLYLVDNDKAYFGTGGDFQIYHDASNSIIKQEGTGNLFIQAQTEKMAAFNCNAGVELYYNNVKQFATMQYGAYLYGPEGGTCNLYMSADEGDDAPDQWRLRVLDTSSQWSLENYNNGSAWEANIKAVGDGAVELYYDGTKYLSTDAGGVRFAGWGSFADNGKAYFGTGNDLQIYHDGSNSNIKNTTGWLNFLAGGSGFSVGNVDFSENLFRSLNNGATELYYDGSKKLETKSNGVGFSDNTFHVDNKAAHFGTGNDLYIMHDGTHSYMTNGTGAMLHRADDFRVQNGAGSEVMINAAANGAVELYHNNVKKFETTASGVDIAGNCTITGNFRGNDNVKLNLGNGDDLQIWHDGSNTYFHNNVGHWYLRNNYNSDQGGNIYIMPHDNEEGVTIHDDGAVEIFYDGSKKLETQNGGCHVTGSLTADTVAVQDNEKFLAGNNDDLQMYHDGTHSFLQNNTGNVFIRSNGGNVYLKAVNTEDSLICRSNGDVELYYDGSKKVETASTGLSITADNDIRFTNGNWTGDTTAPKIQAHGNYLYILGGSNGIIFRENGSDRAMIDGSGNFRPGSNNTYDLGSSSYKWRNVYTNDLNLSNEGGDGNSVDGTTGDWTIQEGANDLFIVNNKNGKKFKFALQEVS